MAHVLEKIFIMLTFSENVKLTNVQVFDRNVVVIQYQTEQHQFAIEK